jgi:hypothetical protein
MIHYRRKIAVHDEIKRNYNFKLMYTTNTNDFTVSLGLQHVYNICMLDFLLTLYLAVTLIRRNS